MTSSILGWLAISMAMALPPNESASTSTSLPDSSPDFDTASSPAFRFRDGGFNFAARRLGMEAEAGGLPLIRVEVEREDGSRFSAAIDRSAIVQVEEGADVDALFARYGLHGARISAGARLWRVEGASGEDGLMLAARLRDAEALSIAAPNFYLAREVSTIDVPPNDPRYGGEWFLGRVNIEEAWALSTGKPETTVVVIDNGCDVAHPDLVGKLDPGRDVIDQDDDPSFVPGVAGNEHGTACAGIVAADTNNGLGVAGACPECRLRCVRLLGGNGGLIPLNADIQAFEFAVEKGAAVISNSWAFRDPMPAPASLRAAVENAIDHGRGGLGAVVVFAAGNENREIADDELAAIRGVIAVGATTIYDETTAFSNRGNAVDLVAPTGTLTTDISGPDGHDPTDYTTSFGGTSSACPLVAGIAGLLVSAKPEATGAEIAAALIETTRPAPYAMPDANGHDPLYGRGIVAPGPALRKLLGIAEPAADGGVLDAGAPDSGEAMSEDDSGCQDVRTRRGDEGWASLGVLFAAAVVRRRRGRRGAREGSHSVSSALGPPA